MRVCVRPRFGLQSYEKKFIVHSSCFIIFPWMRFRDIISPKTHLYEPANYRLTICYSFWLFAYTLIFGKLSVTAQNIVCLTFPPFDNLMRWKQFHTDIERLTFRKKEKKSTKWQSDLAKTARFSAILALFDSRESPDAPCWIGQRRMGHRPTQRAALESAPPCHAKSNIIQGIFRNSKKQHKERKRSIFVTQCQQKKTDGNAKGT